MKMMNFALYVDHDRYALVTVLGIQHMLRHSRTTASEGGHYIPVLQRRKLGLREQNWISPSSRC